MPGRLPTRSSSVSWLQDIGLWALSSPLRVPQNGLRRPSFLQHSILPLIWGLGSLLWGASREGYGTQSATRLSPQHPLSRHLGLLQDRTLPLLA